MAEKSLENSLARPRALRIGNAVVDIYPIRIKDWPEASKVIYILDFESLADIAYLQGIDSLRTLALIAARSEESERTDLVELIDSITNDEYRELRATLMEQNDIDMERLHSKLAKLTGNQKNAQTPLS
mgnify:CR=1 FL=1